VCSTRTWFERTRFLTKQWRRWRAGSCRSSTGGNGNTDRDIRRPDWQAAPEIWSAMGLRPRAACWRAGRARGRAGPPRAAGRVPVGGPGTCEEFADITDETVCARTPDPFAAVGLWYEDFSQTSDEEVRALLREHREHADQARRR